MKKKIKEALKTKYAALGLSEEVFDGVAESLEKTVTEESQIETAIAGVEKILQSFQKVADQMRNEKSGLQKQLDDLKKKGGKPKEGEGEGTKMEFPSDTPEWMKVFIENQKKQQEAQAEEIKTLKESIGKMQTGNVAEKRKAALNEALKESPDFYKEAVLDNFNPNRFESDDDFNSYTEGVKTKGRELSAKANSFVPGSGKAPSGEASDKEVEALAKSLTI